MRRANILATAMALLLAVPGTAAAISTDPTSLAFGNVPLNTKVTKDVAVTVDAGYRVNGAYMPFTPGFSLDFWTCLSLVAPGTCTVKVSYTPTTLGDVTDTMTLIEQAVAGTDRQFVPIGLTATGVEATPPTTTASAISGTGGYSFGTWARANVVVTLSATDNDGGSGVDRSEYTLDGGASTIAYTAPFAVSSEGESSLQFRSTDNVGNVETVQNATIKIDKTAPIVAITDPAPDEAVQDIFGFTAVLSDSMSGPDSLSFSVRSDDGSADGKPIGFEKLAATKVGASGSAATFRLGFDTTKLPDGYYLLLAQGFDGAGNVTSSSAEFHVKVVNLALVKMLPATDSNKAGRTMPVKFSLRESSTRTFIENQQLTIKIHQKGSSSILQSSTYGTGATSYRIDSAAGLYIANFQTGKTPTTYVVEVWRQTATAPLLIGTFDFQTMK
jgi:hypothetical protein